MNRRSFLGILAGLVASAAAPFKAKAAAPVWREVEFVGHHYSDSGTPAAIIEMAKRNNMPEIIEMYWKFRQMSGHLDSLGTLGKGEPHA